MIAALFGMHRRTDPACALFVEPVTRRQRRRFEAGRGLSCPVCMPPARPASRSMLVAWDCSCGGHGVDRPEHVQLAVEMHRQLRHPGADHTVATEPRPLL